MEPSGKKDRPEHNKNESIWYWNIVFLLFLSSSLLVVPYIFCKFSATATKIIALILIQKWHFTDSAVFSLSIWLLYFDVLAKILFSFSFLSFLPLSLSLAFLSPYIFFIHHWFVINYIIVKYIETSSGILQHHLDGLEVEWVGCSSAE